MALIVETGTGLDDADSYISLVDARAWAANNGYSLAIDDDDANIQLRKGAIDVDLSEGGFPGSRLNNEQSLAWARINAYSCTGQNQTPIPPNVVPNKIKYAQVIYGDAYQKGITVRANDDGLSVASKKVVGAVEVSYHDNGKTGKSTEITEATDMLSNYMCVGSMFTLSTVRV